MGIRILPLQWFQIALEYQDLKKGSRFVWYPTTGTLVFEGGQHKKYKNFNKRYKKKYFDSEEVFNEIMKKVIK